MHLFLRRIRFLLFRFTCEFVSESRRKSERLKEASLVLRDRWVEGGGGRGDAREMKGSCQPVSLLGSWNSLPPPRISIRKCFFFSPCARTQCTAYSRALLSKSFSFSPLYTRFLPCVTSGIDPIPPQCVEDPECKLRIAKVQTQREFGRREGIRNKPPGV